MNEYERKVADFHIAFDAALNEPLSAELLSLRKTLLAEEMRELFEEIDKAISSLQEGREVPRETFLNLMKEMADVQYVLSGMAVTFGLPVDKVFARVHDSNMSKLGPDGKPQRRGDGKILKGPSYHPPILDDLA